VISGAMRTTRTMEMYHLHSHGGNDPVSGKQMRTSPKERHLALAKSCDEGLPVRVSRGGTCTPNSRHRTVFYRYDGLYYVDEYWTEVEEWPSCVAISPDPGIRYRHC